MLTGEGSGSEYGDYHVPFTVVADFPGFKKYDDVDTEAVQIAFLVCDPVGAAS